MAMQEAGGHCLNCAKDVLVKRQGTSHVLHLLLSLITVGFWIPVWFLSSVKIGGWSCGACGGKARRR